MDTKYKCDTCGKCLSKKSKLVEHIRTHTKEKPFSCSTCGKSFTQRSQVKVHKRIHTNERPFGCGSCDKRFIQKGQLVSHIISVHTKEKPFVCELCKKGFVNKTKLRGHISSVHNKERNFVCELCESSFVSRRSLHNHFISKHKGERPIACEVCKKTFRFKHEMLRHIKRVHTSPKVRKNCVMENKELPIKTEDNHYACKTCSKLFSRKSCFVRHQRVHNKERPFICDVCSRPFSDSGNLLKHKRLHTNEKPYSCDMCDKAFTQKAVLLRHLKSRIHSVRYPCPICRIMFPSKSDLSIHMGAHLNPSNQAQDLNPKDKQCTSERLDIDLYGERDLKLKQDVGEDCGVVVSDVQKSGHVEDEKEVKVEVCSESFVDESENISQVIDVKEHIMEEQSDSENNARTSSSETDLEKNPQIIPCESYHACEIYSMHCSHERAFVKQYTAHMKKEPFNCDTCKKTIFEEGEMNLHPNATPNASLLGHMKTHSQKKQTITDIIDEKDMEQAEHVAKVCGVEKTLSQSSVEKVEVICDESVEVFEIVRQSNERDEGGFRTVEKLDIFSKSIQKAEVGSRTIQQTDVLLEVPDHIEKASEITEKDKLSGPSLDDEDLATEYPSNDESEQHMQTHLKEMAFQCNISVTKNFLWKET